MQTKVKYLSVLLGLFYCLFFLWNRLLRIREPIDLFTEYTRMHLFVYIVLFIGSLLIVLFFIRKLLKITSEMLFLKKILENPRIATITSFIVEYILNAPKNLYQWLYEHIHIRDKMTPIGQFIYYQNFNERIYKMGFILGFMYSFQILLCFTFIHNVFILHKLTYFYKAMVLLIIPLILRIIIFMQYDLAKQNKKSLEALIVFVPNESNNGFVMSRTENHKDDPNLTKERMDYLASYWYMYLHSLMSIDHFHRIETKVKPLLYIFCYTLYAIGWGYILYRIYFNEYS